MTYATPAFLCQCASSSLLIFPWFSGTSKAIKKGADNLLKNPILFGIIIAGIVILQIAVSYLSATAILQSDVILGLSLFLFVPVLGLALGYYIVWFRKQKASNSPN
jgi:hypothetical protein